MTLANVEAILPKGEQIPGETHHANERVRATVYEVKKAGSRVKEGGERNPLLELVASDPAFRLDAERLAELLDAGRFVGRAPEQVSDFLADSVEPWLASHRARADDEEPQV